ncbi:MAG: PGN_0703 family putative restriction endonuclease [Roseovarius sp.]
MTVDILFSRRWPKSSLAQDISNMDVASYCQAYRGLKVKAPKRTSDQPYLAGRTGFPSTEATTNRREEHFAIAMVNAQQCWTLPDGTALELLDYQVPLKSRRADREIGKIDIFGLTEHGRPVVVELKVIGHSGGPSDPPPVAFLEGLRYAAIVEANLERFADEVRRSFGREMVLERPDIVILGEADWWSRWLGADEGAKSALEKKARDVSQLLDLGIVFASVPNTTLRYGQRTFPPRLAELPRFDYPHTLPRSTEKAAKNRIDHPEPHEAHLRKTWWRHAKTLHEGDLDGIERAGRPPVVSPKSPSLNLMLPRDREIASAIESEIAPTARHKHFRSFRSSQAMAQSVFGAFKSAGRLDLLSRVQAECGRPAFGKTTMETTLSMELDVQTFAEPRPTQLDVHLETNSYRVAVECKFCEIGFGTCSRVQAGRTDKPLCNGNYSHQQGRRTRCALSEVGVSYWEFIPAIFDWNATQDMCPCPLLPTYQIVRNILAAVVDEGGAVTPSKGHALFVYDGRNPAYKIGGAADSQLRQAAAACKIPGTLRRVTWQEVVRACSGSAELTWLQETMSAKHGIYPNA